MEKSKQKQAVWFFTAYHIVRDGAEKAAELCRSGQAEKAAELLDGVIEDAEKSFYESIDGYLLENPMSSEELEYMFGKDGK